MNAPQRRHPISVSLVKNISEQQRWQWVRRVKATRSRTYMTFTREMEMALGLKRGDQLLLRKDRYGRIIAQRLDGKKLGEGRLQVEARWLRERQQEKARLERWAWNMREKADLRRLFRPREKSFQVPAELAAEFYLYVYQQLRALDTRPGARAGEDEIEAHVERKGLLQSGLAFLDSVRRESAPSQQPRSSKVA
jgi:hypothetical protein